MKWHHIKHRVTGEEQFKASLEGIDQEEYEIMPLDREPTDCDECKNGKLVENTAKKNKLKKQARIKADIYEYIETLETRLAALEAKMK